MKNGGRDGDERPDGGVGGGGGGGGDSLRVGCYRCLPPVSQSCVYVFNCFLQTV